jgi:hypothetical protein
MPTITLNDSPYHGSTSRPPWRRPHDPGVRLEPRRPPRSSPARTTRGIRFVTEIFRGRCGRGRHIKREVAATG